VLGPVEDVIAAKARLSLVVNGALTNLPLQLLVTRDPAGKALKDVDWLLRTHAVMVLLSVASLKVLRRKSAVADAKNPLIGFANPVFDRDAQQLAQNKRLVAAETAARGIRGSVADITKLKALLPLPETADELRQVAASAGPTRPMSFSVLTLPRPASSKRSSINTASSILLPTACPPARWRITPSSTPSRRWC
jgi:CHAT domain-containing protein